MQDLTSELACFGCEERILALDPISYRCPGARGDDGIDHVLRCHLVGDAEGWRRLARTIFDDHRPNPFLRYAPLLHSVHRARAAGLGQSDIESVIEELDRNIARIDGHGFAITPFGPAPQLARSLGFDAARLLVKDETANVSGSHKARHLMGVMIWLEAARRAAGTPPGDPRPRLAIASCGNAALAAAVVAKAAGYPLDVYVPPDANPAVIERLLALDAHLTPCPRRPDERGDPCYHRFLEAVQKGGLPFTCQGPENGLVIDGGQTLVWEMVSVLRARGHRLDRLFVQVGGGALASACVRGLWLAHQLGVLPAMPTIHVVQAVGCAPLHRAWRHLAEEIARRHAALDADAVRSLDDGRLAAQLASRVSPADLDVELHRAARQRGRYMWPWERQPQGLATGILDDETYDWLAVVEGMLRSGGFPLVVDEETIVEANGLTHQHTHIRADPTGTAGLAGLLRLHRSGIQEGLNGETVAVLMTGAVR